MPRRNAGLCDLPVELKVLVLSHIEHVETGQILGLSSDVWEALSLLRALQQAFYFEGALSEFADHLVRLLGDDRVRSLGKERAVELIGDDKGRLCEHACGRNFEVLKWAHNELDLPWAPYPVGRVSDDVLALRVLRESSSVLKQCWREDVVPEEWDVLRDTSCYACYVIQKLKQCWREDVRPEGWRGVTMVDGRVEELRLYSLGLCAVPAEIGQLTSLTYLHLGDNRLTSVPAEIGQLTSLTGLNLYDNRLTSVPAEIGQLTSLTGLNLYDNRLTSVPAEIGQLTSLKVLNLEERVTVDE